MATFIEEIDTHKLLLKHFLRQQYPWNLIIESPEYEAGGCMFSFQEYYSLNIKISFFLNVILLFLRLSR